MAKRRKPKLTLKRWLSYARSKAVQKRISDSTDLKVVQEIVTAVRQTRHIGWTEAVAILHMVYGWMPTMLRNIGARKPQERKRLVRSLSRARSCHDLAKDDLELVTCFANGSVVGASKLLHVICPKAYPIWDSRVAATFLWSTVTRGTFNNIERYIEYKSTLRKWEKYKHVARMYSKLRKLNPALSKAPNLRLLELVIFRSRK